MERDQALALVALLQAGYPGRPLPDPSVNLYAEALLPCDYNSGERAIKWLITDSAFMPAISEVLEAIASQSRPFGDSVGTPRLGRGEFTDEEKQRSREAMEEVLGPYLAKWKAHQEESEPERKLRYTKASKVTAPRCSGAGQAPEIRDGKAFCPGCGVAIEEMFA